jgi:hypothetical protein
MARARNIKPGFYKNEDLAECSVWARLIFPGMWMLADREGRLEDRPKRIKGELLPFDSQEIDPLLQELQQHGFIVRYENSDGRFIQILKFSEHQQPHYSEKPSVIKPPPLQEDSGKCSGIKTNGFQEHSGSTPGNGAALRGGRNPLNPESGFLNPESRILNPEGDSSEPFGSEPPTDFAIPLNDGTEYVVATRTMAEWAQSFPAVDVEQELRGMRAWALANKARRKTRRGVEAFAVRWLQKAQDRPSNGNGRSHSGVVL